MTFSDRPGAVDDGTGVPWHYGSPLAEQRALAAGEGVVVTSLGVVRLTGDDRLALLQALTSQEVAQVPPGASTETLLLDPNGRIENAAALVDDGTATWLITEKAADLAAFLTRMRFRMAVTADDVSAEYAVLVTWGAALAPLAWTDPWPAVAPGSVAYGPSRDVDWSPVYSLVPRGGVDATVGSRPLAGTWALEALRIAAGRPRLADIDDKAIAHELDWLRTAVHLHKGCYRGQETIARVHNLGRPPRRLVLLHLDGSDNVLPAPGDAVLAGERPVGTIRAAAQHVELGPIALAFVRRSTPPDAPLVVAAGDVRVAATQEVLVGVDGVTAERPPERPALAKFDRKPHL